LLFTALSYAQVGINTATPDASAALDINSTNAGLLIPRLTQDQRDAVLNPATGLLIYQTDNSPGFYFYDGTSWKLIGGTGISSSAGSQYLTLGFSSSTSWTCPVGVSQIIIELWGGGGGGGGSSYPTYLCRTSNTSDNVYGRSGLNGGKGGYLKQTIDVIPGNSYNIVIGNGGQGGPGGIVSSSATLVSGQNGQDGGNTLFNGSIIAGFGTAGEGGKVNCVANGTTAPPTHPARNPPSNNGVVTNYTHLTTSPSSVSYIPSSYLSQLPTSVAQGGNGSPARYSFRGNPPGNAGNGANGQQGYCVISYRE
jgi:hypothetical protein